MYDCLRSDRDELFSLNDIQMFLLLFADDTVLFSYSKEGLQDMLNKLGEYCKDWGIHVNINKTVVMVFKKGNRPENIEIKYENTNLTVVTKFTYLGVTLSSNGSFYQAQKDLSKQALRALFSLNSLFDIVQLEISEKLKLFDSVISPILNYSSCVWGFHKAPDIERIHLKFLKQVLRVKQKTTNAAVYGELARVPLIVIRKVRILKFWFKTLKFPDSLQYKCLFMRDNNGNIINEWAKNICNLLDSLGFSFLWNNANVSNLQLQEIIRTVYDQYYQEWFATLRTSPKLDTYCSIKNSFQIENYLLCVKNIQHRTALTRFRCSAHRLLIEEGRYRNIPRDERKCIKCNMNVIETEYHFLLVCPCYRNIRSKFLPKYFCKWPSIQKFNTLLTSSNKCMNIKLAKYIYECFKARE